MSDKKEVFISVDVETSGPIPGEFSLLTIGAANVDDVGQTFECKLKPFNHNADPKALEVTGLSLDELERSGLPAQDAMTRLGDWITQLAGSATPVFVGFNAPFDWSFVNYYFHRFTGANPFGFSALDIKAYYMGATGCSWHETRSSSIAKKLRPKLAGNHNALDDALYQAELFRLVRAEISSKNSGVSK